MLKQALVFGLLAASPIMVYADTFGGLEIGHAKDTNFNGAPSGGNKLSEGITSYSGYMGYYTPIGITGSTAFIVKGSIQAYRFDTAKSLNNNTYGLNSGIYHAFSTTSSMTALLGARTNRFDNSALNGNVYDVNLGFKQNTGENFWFREGLSYEKGTAKNASGEYRGYSASGSLNYKPADSTLLIAGASWYKRNYNTLTASIRTGNQVTLSVIQSLSKAIYLRAGANKQWNKIDGGNDYTTMVYSVALGFAI